MVQLKGSQLSETEGKLKFYPPDMMEHMLTSLKACNFKIRYVGDLLYLGSQKEFGSILGLLSTFKSYRLDIPRWSIPNYILQ